MDLKMKLEETIKENKWCYRLPLQHFLANEYID
jgi:hypothetical protein